MRNSPAPLQRLIVAEASLQNSGQPVHNPWKPVFTTVSSLCKFFVQNPTTLRPLRTIPSLCAGYPSAYALDYPHPDPVFNRGVARLIPTVHSPNNKNYIDTLKKYERNLWKEPIL